MSCTDSLGGVEAGRSNVVGIGCALGGSCASCSVSGLMLLSDMVLMSSVMLSVSVCGVVREAGVVALDVVMCAQVSVSLWGLCTSMLLCGFASVGRLVELASCTVESCCGWWGCLVVGELWMCFWEIGLFRRRLLRKLLV